MRKVISPSGSSGNCLFTELLFVPSVSPAEAHSVSDFSSSIFSLALITLSSKTAFVFLPQESFLLKLSLGFLRTGDSFFGSVFTLDLLPLLSAWNTSSDSCSAAEDLFFLVFFDSLRSFCSFSSSACS